MIIAYFALLFVVVSLLCGGRLKYMAENPLRGILLPPIAFAVEGISPFLAEKITIPLFQWHWAAVVLEYLLLFLFCALNWRRKGIRLVALGSLLNFFVIAWYGFRMPVAPIVREFAQMAPVVNRIESGELFEYVLAEAGSPFLFLGDALVIPFYHAGLASIGDLMLAIGIGRLVFGWMRPPERRQPPPSRSGRK